MTCSKGPSTKEAGGRCERVDNKSNSKVRHSEVEKQLIERFFPHFLIPQDNVDNNGISNH